ncbi:MAG: hypothetical protein Q4C47_01715, partial [Planctomycetia bacterium]|nr:hypothetical protein [Planctomycetia bacterium]
MTERSYHTFLYTGYLYGLRGFRCRGGIPGMIAVIQRIMNAMAIGTFVTHGVFAVIGVILVVGMTGSGMAREIVANNEKKYRELYVPASELNVILESAPQRAMVSRGEFDELVRKIRTLDQIEKAERERLVAPLDSVLVESSYEIRVEEGRAKISGTLRFEILRNEAVAVPLEWSGAAMMDAELDGHPASFVTLENGERFLLIPAEKRNIRSGTDDPEGDERAREGTGVKGGTVTDVASMVDNGTGDAAEIGEEAEKYREHKSRSVYLKLTLTAPLETTAVLQTLRCTVPEATVRRVKLEAAGDVEIKRGAAVISRKVIDDETTSLKKRTRFELVPGQGSWEMTLTLNSHTRRGGVYIATRSVQIAEVTRGYQRMYATFSVQILRQAKQRFQFVLPETFEVDHVELLGCVAPADDETATATLSSWRMGSDDSRMIEILLREPAVGTLVFGITAVQNSTSGTEYMDDARIISGEEPVRWSFPAILPVGTESHSGVFGLICEDILEPYRVRTRGLLPLDMTLMEKAIPASALTSEPGLPVVRSIAAYYAPMAGLVPESMNEKETVRQDRETGMVTESAWDFTMGFRRPSEELFATTSVFVEPGVSGTRLRADIVLTSIREKMFEARIDLPPGWNVVRVSGDGESGNETLSYERLRPSGSPAEKGPDDRDHIASNEEAHGERTDSVRLRIVPERAIRERTDWKISIDAIADTGLWGGSTESTVFSFPEIVVVNATRISGVIAVGCDEDYTARPEGDVSESLIPVSERDAVSLCRTEG